MIIEQFFDKGLAHLSYVLISEGEAAIIDPARDASPYYQFINRSGAKIKFIIETHPHADFVSSHLEISKAKNGVILTSKLTGARYPHKTFDDGDEVMVGLVKLRAINTPGHSPDSICVTVEVDQKVKAVFTGDTLFIGDVGRPDLRESVGNLQLKKHELAGMMYDSLRQKLMALPDATIVYPAHGAGSFCGKAMSQELSGTIGQQKMENYAMQPMAKEAFIDLLLEEQPFIPKYFPYNVEVNREGAEELSSSIKKVNRVTPLDYKPSKIIIDTRTGSKFKTGHFHGAINIPNGGKFETWLGALISPVERFDLISDSELELDEIIKKSAKIGYEALIDKAVVMNSFPEINYADLDPDYLKKNEDRFTIVDVRDRTEIKSGKIFPHSIHIPLAELIERKMEVPVDKPIIVHCAGGYRSAIAYSILATLRNSDIFDLGEAIKMFSNNSLH